MRCGNLVGNYPFQPKLDKAENLPQRPKDTKQNRLLNFFFESWYPGGGNALGQSKIDPTLESTKQIPASRGSTIE